MGALLFGYTNVTYIQASSTKGDIEKSLFYSTNALLYII